MPNTTNFNWATPADTDLVKDGAAAIRTLGNSIDSSFVDLKGGTTGQNLRKASNSDLDFTFAGDATNTVVDAAGDLLYGTAADTLGRLAIGTAGQVLKVNSGATAPEWGTVSGGGKVLQVVSATYATATSTSGISFVDSGLSATITPTLSTSKVLVLVHHSIQRGSGNSSNSMDIQLLRDATQILLQSFLMSTNTTLTQIMMHSTNFLDSPATTSATTYKTQFKNNVSAANVTINANNDTSSITLLEIGA